VCTSATIFLSLVMYFRIASPRLASVAGRGQLVRTFRSSAILKVNVGDGLPDVELMEESPGNKVNLKDELSEGKGLIIGVPAAFSPSCSNSHIPGYISHKKLSSAGRVFVVSVNDPFVMKAWATSLDPSGSSDIRFIADPKGEFTSALDLDFDATAIFGNRRSVRYALVTRDGKVKSTHIEPERTAVDVSAASKVLGS